MTAIFGSGMRVIVYACSVMSILSCLAVLICYWSFPHVRTFVTKTIMWLAVAELLSAVFRFLTDCDAFAGMQQFTGLSSFCWMATVAIVQYATSIKHHRLMFRYEKLFHLINWGFPALDAIIIAAADEYGEAGVWCWITEGHEIGRWLGYFVWLFSVLAICCYCYGSIIITLENRLNSSRLPSAAISHHNTKQFQRELLLYLCVIIAVRIWSVMDRFFELLTGRTSPDLILYLHAGGASIQGAVNCWLLFFNNRPLRQRLSVGINELYAQYQRKRDMKALGETDFLAIAEFTHESTEKDHRRGSSAGTSLTETYRNIHGKAKKYEEIYPQTFALQRRKQPKHFGDKPPAEPSSTIGSSQLMSFPFSAFDDEHYQSIGQYKDEKSQKPVKPPEMIQTFRVHVATWHANKNKEYIDKFGNWLPNYGKKDNFQSDLESGAEEEFKGEELIVVNTVDLDMNISVWERGILTQLGSRKYVKVYSYTMRQIHAAVFVRRDCRHMVGEILPASTGSAWIEFYGDKLGAGLSIQFGGLMLGFVCVDLLEEALPKLPEKLVDLEWIASTLWLGRPEIDFIHQFNALFWLGHMNFGIETSDAEYDVYKFLKPASDDDSKEEEKQGMQSLLRPSPASEKYPFLAHDQLQVIVDRKRFFHDFTEPLLNFAPTYRVNIDQKGSETYDKQIVPRWCSRILYYNPPHPSVDVIPQTYQSTSQLLSQKCRHRPVSASFIVNRYNSWFPHPSTRWNFVFRNVRLVFSKKQLIRRNVYTAKSTSDYEGLGDIDPRIFEEEDDTGVNARLLINDFGALYLTFHAPFLTDKTVKRSPLGKVVQENSETVVIEFPFRMGISTEFDDNNVRRVGNLCLWVVVRDENLLGDLDSMASCAIPLLYDEDVMRSALEQDDDDDDDTVGGGRSATGVDASQSRTEGDHDAVEMSSLSGFPVFYSFETALTLNTIQRGTLHGEIAVQRR